MKKLLMIILVFSLLSFLFLISCSVENPRNTQVTSNNDEQDNQSTSQVILYAKEDKSENVYTQIDLGQYIGEKSPIAPNVPTYKIIKTYGEAVSLTSNSEILRKEIFNDYYILAIVREGTGYKTKTAFFKDLSYINGQLYITEVTEGQSNSYGNYINDAFILVPKNQLKNIEDEYYINITSLEYDYLNTRQIQINSSEKIEDGQMHLIEADMLSRWLEEQGINLPIRSFNTVDNSHFLACYSKGSFDDRLSYRYLNVENGKITITRDYSINDKNGIRAFLDIIPISSSYELDGITTVELCSYGLNKSIPMRKTQMEAVDVIKHKTEYYPHFDGGQYIGNALTETQNYIIISSYEELKQNVRNYEIDKSLFNDSCVLILRENISSIIGLYDLNATALTVKADVGNQYFIYDTNGDDEQIKDGWDISVYYHYLVLPKSILNKMSKTGKLTVENRDIYTKNFARMLKETDLSHLGIKEFDSWLLANKSEVQEFNELYNLNLTEYYEWLVIYANEASSSIYSYSDFGIIGNKAKINIYKNVSATKDEHKCPTLICFAIDTKNQYIENSVSLTVSITDLSGKKYKIDTEKEFEKHQTFTADINACTKGKTKLLKRPEFSSKLITSYEELTALFNEYIDKNVSDVFEESVFNENYVIAIYKSMECYSTNSEYFNVHIGAGAINIYQRNDGFDSGVSHNTLFLIAVPRNEGLLGDKEINLIQVYSIKDANRTENALSK